MEPPRSIRFQSSLSLGQLLLAVRGTSSFQFHSTTTTSIPQTTKEHEQRQTNIQMWAQEGLKSFSSQHASMETEDISYEITQDMLLGGTSAAAASCIVAYRCPKQTRRPRQTSSITGQGLSKLWLPSTHSLHNPCDGKSQPPTLHPVLPYSAEPSDAWRLYNIVLIVPVIYHVGTGTYWIGGLKVPGK